MRKLLVLLVSISLCGLISNCSKTTSAVLVDVNKPAFEQLSDYHFFTGKMNSLQPNVGVLPYDLNSQLFTDYAEKSRFVWMPEGTSAKYNAKEVLDFPVGSVLIKNFYYNHDGRDLTKGSRIMETRLLVNRTNGWDAISYIWNDAQTEAYLEVAGDVKKVDWISSMGEEMSVNYVIPNKNQCKGCHEYKGELVPIGPKVRNLNKTFDYADGSENQLTKWASMNYLTGYDSNTKHPKVAQWDNPNGGNLHDRAMAYLEINCGHCHRKDGPAGISGLNLMADETNTLNMGICKSPVSAGKGSGGHTYDIVPGAPEKSILVHRMQINDPGARMPEVGRSIMHKEGVELITAWIANMEGSCPESIDGE